MTDFLANSKLAKLYRDVPPEYLAPYGQFRMEHPFKHITQEGVAWEYYDLGKGPETRLTLTGALGIPYFDWHHLLHFAQTSRVIAPCYPPVDTMDALCDGIAGIVRHEGIEKVHVQGGSYGGFVAQVFVRRYPEMTASLILSHTQPPYPDDEGMAKIRKSLRWMRVLPASVLRWVMNLSLSKLMPDKTPYNALLIAIYNELLYYRLTKASILSILTRAVDYERRRFTPEDLSAWPGRILIMMTDNDRTTPEEVREDFAKLYPQAQTHIFEDSGHATSWEQADAYRAVIDAFVKYNS
ncbi:MAG: alpha/beta hydrolase [Anaerolineae bacterium]|nr:alpha/beta hydrolase [Anaerolineae bacterium]